jgi:hypothetical protein
MCVMRRLRLLALLVLLCAIPAHGQSTTVSGTITDAGGQAWFAGTIQFLFRPAASNPTAQYMWNGAPFSSSSTFPQNPLSLDGTGSFSGLSIPSNTAIAPAGSQWAVTVCSAATVPNCYTKLLTISGTTQNISSQVIPPSVVVNLTVPLIGARAYTDAEVVGAAAGTSYLNVTDNTLHLCIQSGFPPCTWHSIVSSTAIIFAENYPNIQAAINACPSTGCIVLASSPSVNLAMGSIDPGPSKTVTLILGPYTYTVTTITLEPNFRIIGMGQTDGTVLQSNNTTSPIFVINQTTGTGIAGVEVANMRIYCGAGNTSQTAFSIVAPTSGGLWYSSLHDLDIGGNPTFACAGNSVLLSANGGGFSINQWIDFTNVYAFRTNGGAPALEITGLNGQLQFDHTQWDGPTPRDNNKVNILINDGTQSFRPPYSIIFTDLTSQLAWGASGVAVQVNGLTGLTIDNGHFENDNGGVSLAIGNHFGNWGNTVKNSQFDTGTGIDGGSGFITSTDVNSQLAFDDNAVANTPDTMHAGNITYLTHKGTMNLANGQPYPSPNSSVRNLVGYDPDSPSLKHKRISTGSITGGTRASVALTWTTPFADANYTVGCSVIDTANGPTAAGMIYERLNAVQTATGISATVNNAGVTGTGVLDCWAWHD